MVTNYVKPLALFQSGAEAVKATGTLTMDTQPTANDTITIGGTTYTWKASGAVAGEINRGADLAAAKVNLVAAINGTDGINTPNLYVTAAAFVSNDMVVTARISGPAGNAIATTETFTAGSNVWGASTLASGAHARGTAVAATAKHLKYIDFEAEDAVERPDYAVGIGYENVGYEVVSHRGGKWSVPDYPLNFEELTKWLTWAVGYPVLTGTGSTGVLTATITPSLGADPSLSSRTIERELSNGSGVLDDEWPFAICTKWGFKWTAGAGLVMQSAEGRSRKRTDSTLTAALSAPTPTHIPNALATVYLNDTFATIGNTQITGQVIGGEFAYYSGYDLYHASDGRTQLDASDVEWNPKARRFELTLRIRAKHSGQAATERTKAEAAALRGARIRFADATSGQSVNFDMLVKHEPGTQIVKVEQANDQDIIVAKYVQSTDLTNCFKATLVTTRPYDD